MIKYSNNIKLFWVVFIKKCDWNTHYAVIVRWNGICIWDFNGIVIIIVIVLSFPS